jgi:hypothetical protein
VTPYDLVKALGGTMNGKWLNIPGPGHSPADRSLGICFDPNAPDGFVVKSLAGDDEKHCRQYVKSLLKTLSGGTVIASPAFPFNGGTAVVKRIEAAAHLWSQTVEAASTPAETYLASRRCVTGDWDAVIRFHPDCPFSYLRAPAMMALVQNVLTGEPQGVHRTALSGDGKNKRTMPVGLTAKMMLGVARGGAVILGQAEPHLGIAEGIETALSAEKLFGIPVWALLSASGIASFPVIPGVTRLTIFADHDEAGLKAAAVCARRYLKAGIKGERHTPPTPGDDWNDYLQSQGDTHE